MRDCRDARRPVDVDADVALGRDVRRAGVDAHPDLDRARGERALSLDRSFERRRRGAKGEKERVALRVHLDAPVACSTPRE